MPCVDCRIELDTRVCTVPCSFVDLSPKFSRIERLRNFAIGTTNEIPISVGVYGVHELVAESNGVVGILTADGVIRFSVEVIIQFQAESICNCMLRFAQLLHPFDQRRNLNFLADFPIYKRFDIRMIDIEAAHLCSSPSCPSRLDRSCGTVADLEETHQSRTLSAAGERLAVSAKAGEICACSRSILKESRFAYPQIHNAAFIHQVIVDGLNETCVRLRMRIGIGSAFESTGSVIGDPMPLSRTVDSICPSQTSIEPLRAVWRSHLVQEHVSDFIVKRLRIFGCFEISVRFSPVFPASCESMHHLFD